MSTHEKATLILKHTDNGSQLSQEHQRLLNWAINDQLTHIGRDVLTSLYRSYCPQ